LLLVRPPCTYPDSDLVKILLAQTCWPPQFGTWNLKGYWANLTAVACQPERFPAVDFTADLIENLNRKACALLSLHFDKSMQMRRPARHRILYHGKIAEEKRIVRLEDYWLPDAHRYLGREAVKMISCLSYLKRIG